jgi:hypothetical protein
VSRIIVLVVKYCELLLHVAGVTVTERNLTSEDVLNAALIDSGKIRKVTSFSPQLIQLRHLWKFLICIVTEVIFTHAPTLISGMMCCLWLR